MINTGYNAIKLFKIPYNLQQNYKFEKINTKLAYSDKMLFLDLGPGTSDLGSLI